MKIAILGDTHFGMRNDSAVFNELARKFYTEVFFPYLEQHGIGNVIQLGDLFDRRKFINFNILASAKEYFFNPLDRNGITLYALLGNHDIFYRNTLRVNSPSLVLPEYSRVCLIDKPSTIVFGGNPVDLIPWICEENEKEIAEFIKNSKSDFCFGHFELAGFEMDRGNFCHEGMDVALLSKYEQVISGHFHHKSSKGNILYTGVPYQMTWADWNDPKGFHVFDTETREMEFIHNPNEIYVKIGYNDDNLFFDEVQNGDYSAFTGKYVKVIVEKKSNSFLFETLIEALTKANPIDVSIVEDFTDISIIDANGDGVIDQADDTLAIIDKVVEGMEIDLQKPRLKSILREVYNEALASES
jgi:DNA repair exonuclease SbcCD nuclease subunit